MSVVENNFDVFAKGLVTATKQIDPNTLRIAKGWYKQFAGPHAVMMNDRDLVEIYEGLH